LQRQFRYVCIQNQNAFRSEICMMFFIVHNYALCSEILVHFNCTPIRFLQRHLWYVILVHKNALCSEMFVVLYCTPTRFLQRIFWYSLLYTKTLCAAKFWYIFTPKRFLQRNCTEKRFVQRNFGTCLHQNAFCSEICVLFFLHQNAFCSEICGIFYCTQKRFVQRMFCAFLLYTKTL